MIQLKYFTGHFPFLIADNFNKWSTDNPDIYVEDMYFTVVGDTTNLFVEYEMPIEE